MTIPPVRPERRVTGMSAVLLPFAEDGTVAWDALAAGVARTAEAGLVPAVNMDTGYVNLIDASTREYVLRETRDVLGDRLPAVTILRRGRSLACPRRTRPRC